MLAENERAYLSQLSTNPIWMNILGKFQKAFPVPTYSPNRPKTDEFERWIYHSGKHDAAKDMLQILQGRPITLDLERNDDG